MGTTAEKLTYLNDTKQLLKENINNLGGNLTNEPFRQYASVLEGIYESLPKVSGIGSNLSLSPTMAGKIKLNEIQGDTLQDGTPTPSSPIPIESVTGEQDVEICGKNLFDKDNADIIGSYFDYSNVGLLKSANGNKTLIIECKPNTTYTVSKIASTRFRIGCNNERITTGQVNSAVYGSSSDTSLTITTGANDKYLYVFYWVTSDTLTEQTILDSIMIELGSTATTYEPYKGNTYEVNLGNIKLNKIGDYEDYIFKNEPNNPNYDSSLTLNSWYIEKNIGKEIWNGTENWSMYLLTFTILLNHTQGICYCNRFISKTTQQWSSGNTNNRGYISAYNLATEIKLMPTDENITTVEQFKTWLASNNVEVKYIMATPIYEVITNTTLIEQLETLRKAKSKNGTTNIVITSNDLSMLMDVSVIKGE